MKALLGTNQPLDTTLTLESDCPDSCVSPQSGLLHSPPRHHSSRWYISTKTSFTEAISLKPGSRVALCAEDLCQQHKLDVFGQLGRLLLLGITSADFKPGFILILVKSLHPSRAFPSRLTCSAVEMNLGQLNNSSLISFSFSAVT